MKVNISKKWVIFNSLKQLKATKYLTKPTGFNGKSTVCEKKIISYHHHDFRNDDIAKP